MRDLNVAFLDLLGRARPRPAAPLFGLEAAVVERVARCSAAELEALADTPCLLASFRVSGHRPLGRVAEPAPVADDPEWSTEAQLFAAGLLTYVWQMARRDPLKVALCVGPAVALLARGLRFRDIQGYAHGAVQHLEARFGAHPRFWPDLLRAVRDGRAERLGLARLTAIQLACVEAGRLPRDDGAAVTARSARPRLAGAR